MRQAHGVFRVLVLSLLIIALAVPLSHAPGIAAQATPTATDAAGEQYTPVLQSVPSPPRWSTGSDGRVHLVYELFFANAFLVPVTVTSIAVLAAHTGEVVASLNGDALKAAMSLLTSPATATTELPPASLGVIWFDVPFKRPDELPPSIKHRLTAAVPPGLPVPESITSTSLGTEVDLRPPIVVEPPLPVRAGRRWGAAVTDRIAGATSQSTAGCISPSASRSISTCSTRTTVSALAATCRTQSRRGSLMARSRFLDAGPISEADPAARAGRAASLATIGNVSSCSAIASDPTEDCRF